MDDQIRAMMQKAGFTELTPIQEKTIPEIKNGRDVVGQSSTGSGKTAAFAMPLIEKVHVGKGLQCLILTPTRELCIQVAHVIKQFSKGTNMQVTTVYGGVGIEPQIKSLQTTDVVVGTPGRMLDHLERRTINLHGVRYLVLDEADKMFEMGFIEDVEKIISQIPKERQTMLFSATFSSAIQGLIHKYLKNPVTVKTNLHVDKSLLNQVYYQVKAYDKFSLLVHLLKHKTEGLALIFCATRREVDVVARNLQKQRIHAMAIHGGLSQNKRTQALDLLRNNEIDVLVATDVAARGLDIKNVSNVYNYDVPKTSEEYLHRVGRTARAGNKGEAVTLLVDRDFENFSRVLENRTLEIRKLEIPQFEKIFFQREEQRPRQGRFGQQRETTHRGARPGQRPFGRPFQRERSERSSYSQGSQSQGSHAQSTGYKRESSRRSTKFDRS
jgi:ATP-dependent RNA helicase DeaD